MKTVIEMAREADLIDDTYASDWYVYQLERFAELVRADERSIEREACAKVCEDDASTPEELICAAAIRARGETSLRSNT